LLSGLQLGVVVVVNLLAEQLAGLVPELPVQVQVQGPDPEMAEAVPALHRLNTGAA
jgi:hypothetical protein